MEPSPPGYEECDSEGKKVRINDSIEELEHELEEVEHELEEIEEQFEKKTRMNRFLLGYCAFAAFGGFMFGYDIGSINGVKDMVGFRDQFGLHHYPNETLDNSSSVNVTDSLCSEDVAASAKLGLIVSVFSIGCFFGSICAGVLSDLIGRKPSIMAGGAFYFVGGAFQTAGFYIWMIYLGRVIAGFGVGILFMVIPVYIAELAPKKLRGKLVALISVNLTGGILVGFIINTIMERIYIGWRFSLAVQCVAGATLFFGMFLLPETPRFLIRRHKDALAVEVLKKTHQIPHDVALLEVDIIAKAVKTDNVKKKHIVAVTVHSLLKWNITVRILQGIVLQLLQRLAGITVITYYSVTIFCKIGVAKYISSVVVGMSNFSSSILASYLVDKLGRKALLLSGALGMMVAMTLAATLIRVFNLVELENPNQTERIVGYIVVILVCYFVFNYACGWSGITFVVTSEMFPLEARGIAVACSTSAFWIGNFFIAQMTPILLDSFLKTDGTFYLLAAVHLIAFIFVLTTLPETKGHSLEEIEHIFNESWLARTRIFYYLKCGCFWLKRWKGKSKSQRRLSAMSSRRQSETEKPLPSPNKTSSDSEESEVNENSKQNGITIQHQNSDTVVTCSFSSAAGNNNTTSTTAT